jgi:predicted enzyme related to lactoylglutathione lyase
MAAGGQIIVPKTEISPEYGFMAVFIDTEGNRIGFTFRTAAINYLQYKTT